MVENQEQTTETILHKTSSIAEPDEHRETVIKNYEDEYVKDHIEGDNIDNLPSVGKNSKVKLLSSSSELNTTVEICDTTEVSESLDGKETEDQVSKSMGVKETEGQLPKSSDERKIETPQEEKGDRDFSQEVQLITKETVGEGYREHNGGSEVAEVYKSENKVENFSTASITLDGTEKITDIEKATFEDHRSQTFPEEEPCHIISSGMAEKELHMVSASEDVRSNPEEVEIRGDMKEEITKNEIIGCDTPINVTLQSNSLSVPNKEEAETGEEMNDTPIEETCVAGFRSEAIESSSGIKEIASLDGQSEKARNEEINLKESPREARTDETIDASSTKEKPPFHEKNVSAANVDEEDEIHLYDMGKGQQDAPPLVHEIEASEVTHSEGTQLSAEEPKVMHDIDEADKKLDSSDLGLPLTEEASDKDLAPPCQIDGDNLETESNVDFKKELEIIEKNTEDEEQNADSLVESHNLSIPNDANSKVTKEEIEFDSSSTTLSEEKRDELNVQESEQRKDPQMEGNSEATGLRDGKESDMNDSINENSKLELQVFHKSTSTTEPDEHPEIVPKLYEAENVKASNIESSHGANIDESSSVGNAPSEKLLSSSLELNKATETENGTKQILKSLEGKEIQGQVLEGSDRTETHASESSEGKETEDCDKKSSDGKENQDYHVVEGEWKSTQEIQTITENMLGEGYKGTNGGIAPDGTDTNSHQSEHGENNVKNITRAIVLDNTEKNTSVEQVTFEDHLHRPSVEENSSHTISLSMEKEYVPSASEDLLADLEDIESTAMEEEIINQEIGHGATVNMTLESDHLSNTNKEDMEKNEEMRSYLGSALSVAHIEQTCFTSSTEADVSSLGVNSISSRGEQSETEAKARNTEINLPEVPTEAREDETIDASSEQENQPLDGKFISGDDLKEEDGTNQHDTSKDQPDTHPLVHETEVCEENQVSAEKTGKTDDIDEADRRDQHDTTKVQPDTPPLVHEMQVCEENQVSLLDEQSETEEKARNTEINLPEVQPEAKEDETTDASSDQETQPFDAKTFAADEIQEEDRTNQHGTTKGQPDSFPLVQETEVCEENQISAEEVRETHDVDEADGRDQHATTQCQLDTNEHDTTKGLPDTPSRVHEIEVCKENQVSLLDEQSKTEEQARNTKTNLPEVPTEAKEDETIDGSARENEPFDGKNISADDLNEEDGANQQDTSKDQPDTRPRVHETEVCEEIKGSAEETGKTDGIDEADRRDQHDTTKVQPDTIEHDTTKSQQDTPPLVHEKEVCEENPVSLLNEQSGTEEKARITEINLPEVPTKAKEGETTDASSDQETQPFDAKAFAADDLKEEDRTNQHGTTEGQPETLPLVQETEVCEENQISAEELREAHDVDEADRRDQHETTQCQSDTNHDITKGHPDTPPLVHVVSLLDEHSKTEEQARNTKTNLPEGPTEAKEDETIDANSTQENQPFDGKNISAADLKEEDGTNQPDTSKNQPDTPPLVHETEVCEENQVFAEETGKTVDIDEADRRDKHDTTKVQPDTNEHDTTKGQPDTPPLVHETEVCEEDQGSLQHEQSEIEEKERNTEIHLPEVPTEAKEDETIDASRAQEKQPFDGKTTSADDLKEEDRNNQHDTTKGQPDTPPLVYETEVCEENQDSPEEAGETYDVDEADGRDQHDTTKGQPDFNQHDTIKGQPDTPSLVQETEVREENQVSLLSEQSETEEKAQNTEIHLPEVPTEAKEDETIDASSALENELFDGKNISLDDLMEEDRTIQHGTTKGQLDAPPLVHETEVCEENQISTEESGETHGTDEADKISHSSTVELRPIEGASDMDMIHHCQIDADKVESEIDSTKELQIIFEVPEDIEKNDDIIQTPEEFKEEGTFKDLHSVSEPDIPSHEVIDKGLSSLQGIDTIDSNDKAEERPLSPAENPKTEEHTSITEAPEENEGKEQVQDMKTISLQNIEKKDFDEKPEERVTQPADNSNTENESSTTEVAPETTGDKEHVQDLSIISQQTIDTMCLDEKSKERILAENSNTEQECSRIEVLKETTGDKEHIQDMTNMIFEKTEDTSSHNFMKEADDFNGNADVLVKKESSLKDVHIDEKTFNVYSTDMDDELPLRMNSSSKKDEQVEIRQLETTGGAVYQTEPSETKEIISEMIQMEKPNLNEGSTDMESKTPNKQRDNTDTSQQIQGGKEEIYGIVHGNSGNVEVGHITSSQEKEEATNELQETCVVQPMGEQEHETLDSIKETINEGGIDVDVSSMISSKEKCLLNNDSNTLELRLPSIEGMSDRGRMEEENIHKEKSEETGAETSSPDHSCLTSENSTKDVDNLSVSEGTVTIDELQESKEATDLKSDMLPRVLESETKLHHAEVLSETKKGAIKEESLQAEIGVVNISKEEWTEPGSIENNISREKVKDEGTSNLEREAIPEGPQSITIEDSSETTKKEKNIEKVTDCDINIMQSEKDRADNEYEKSFKSNLQGEKRSISDDFLLTDIPGLSKGGENKELLAEGDKPAQESSLETSEEIKKNIIYDETNEKDEDQVILAADTSDVKVNEVTGHHSITDEDHSKVQDLWLEKDIEMMPESEKTTVQIETQKQQTADDSNAVPGATNLNPELKCTSDESMTIERESTTIRPVDESTLDLTQGPTDNDRFAADKGESLAQLSELHDDHAITNEAEREDPLEHESSKNIKFEIKNSGKLAVSSYKDIEERDPGESTLIISSKYKDIPQLESVSTTVIDIEEVKQIDPCEAVPEPNSTGSSEKEASHDHEETADSPMRVSDLGHGFAEDNMHETGDAASQDQHGNHVIQHVQESSIRSQEGSINDVDGTQQTADLTIATLSTSESLSTPEVDRLMLSTPKDSKDDPQMQQKIAAEDIRVRREILECAESSFGEIKDEMDRITDEPEETTEKLLPAEMSEESTWEKADHPCETSKLKTQQAGTEVKPEEAEVEKEKYNELKEGNSASRVIFIGEKVPDEDTNKIIAGEVKDMSSTIYSNEIISVQVDPEECTEILINREGVELKTDEAKVEEKEQDWQKEFRSGSEVQLMGEKDPGHDTSNKNTTSQMDYSSNMRMSEIILSGGHSVDQVKTDETTTEKENQDGWKGDKTVSEALPMSEKDADGHNIDRSIVAEMKDGTSSATPDDWILVQRSQEDHTEKTTYSEDKEIKTDQDETVEEQDVPKEGNPGADVPLTGEKDPDYHTSKRITKTEMKDGTPSAEPISMTLVHENPGDCTTTVIFSGDKEVKAEGATVETGDQDVQKEEKSDSEVAVVGVTDAEKEKVTPVNTSEAVAQSERLEPDEEKRSSHDYLEIQDALGSTLASKMSQTNQGQDYDEEAKLNAAKIESPEPECAELGSKPENNNNNNNNNKKNTTKEPEESNKLPSEKETPVVEHMSVGHFLEAKKEEVQEENKGRKEDSKAVNIPEHKNKEDEVKEHEEENTALRVRTEASRDAEVKVSPKKSHNLFSGVIKHSISKMKKAITCTNSQLMPQSPR